MDAYASVFLSHATAPLDNAGWSGADKPLQFLAWCMEFKAWQDNPSTFKSHLPIAMDGSNNGLQLMSLLLKDKNIGAATNCTPQETPADIYQAIADDVDKALKSDPKTTHLALLKYGIDRSFMKRAVMSVPYGASYYTISTMFQETFYKAYIDGEEMPFGGQLRAHSIALASVTWKAIHKKMPNILELMDWMKNSIRPAINNNVEVSWVTPLGLRVYQGYRQTIRRRVTTAIGKKVHKQAYFRDPLDNLSPRDNLKAIVPNFIHSLDGSVMLGTTNMMKAEGVNSLAMIHDSFATHACDAPALAAGLREVTIKVFSNNLLEMFDTEIQSVYDDKTSDRQAPPISGELDITQLKESLYFFH